MSVTLEVPLPDPVRFTLRDDGTWGTDTHSEWTTAILVDLNEAFGPQFAPDGYHPFPLYARAEYVAERYGWSIVKYDNPPSFDPEKIY